jgi:outer membrane protein TolC
VENIYRHASEGKTMHQAALDGTNEVGWAVIASTATTVGAFFPMVFWPGVMGSFMGYLPATVIITLIASLFVALFINPAIAAVFLKVKPGEKSKENEVPDNVIYRTYGAVLEWSLNHRAIVIALAVGSFIGTFVAYGALQNGVEFFPGSTPEQFTIKIETADGTRLDDTNELIGRVADPLDGKLDLNYGFTKEELADLEPRLAQGGKLVEAWIEDAGIGGGGGFTGGGAAPHYGRISVDLIAAEQQQSDPEMFMEALRQVYSRVPGATVVLEQQAMGPPSGKPVNIEIVGDELAVQARIAQDIKEKIRGVEGIIDLDDDAELTRPEVLVRVDRKRAALLGTDTRSVASTVRTAVNGSKASVFRDGDDEYDIVVRLPKKERENIQDLLELTVSNRDGLHIPLTEVASIDVEGGSGSIRHKDQDRIVSVSANAAPGNLPADVLKRVQTELEGMKVPAGYELRYAGQNKDQEEAGAFLGRAMLIALFIIAMILVTQFNSIIQPIIILSSVLLSLIGVLWSLILGNEPFGIIMTGIGTISLAGVVVNNSIVLIDYINQLRSRGMDRREAVMVSGLVRFRPVLLTAVTTVLGLMPLVLGVSVDFVNAAVVIGGRSVDLWGPMAKVVSAGLVVSTILTLVIVPVLYSFLDDLARVGNKFIKPAAAATTAMIFGAFVLVTPQLGWTQDMPTKQTADAPAASTPAEDGERFSVPVDVEGDEVIMQKKEDLTPPEISGSRSLGLSQARELVRQNNYDVQIAMANIELADVTISKAYTMLFPTLAASFSSTLYDREVTAAFGPQEIVIRPQVDYNVALSASVRLNAQAWPLLQQARLNKELSKQQVSLVQDELDYSVTQTYYNALLAQRVVMISAEQVANDRLSLRATEKRFELGVSRKFEITRAKLRVAQSELEMERALLGFEQLRQVLAFLLQVEPDFTLEEIDNVVLAKKLEGLKETAHSERLSIRVQRSAVALSEKAREEIYWKYLPTMELSAAAFRPRATAFSPGEWQFSLGLNAQWVLWDGGMREAELDERGAQIVVAKLRQEQSIADVNNQIDQAWAEYLSRKAQLATATTQEQLASESLDEIRRAYELGAAQQLDVLFAEDQLRLTQLAKAQEELQVQLAIRKLLYLAGLD